MPSQRPFFLSSFIAAFRQQGPTIQPTPTAQPNKHTSTTTSATTAAASSSVAASTSTTASAAAAASSSSSSTQSHHHQPHHHHHHHHAAQPQRSAGIPIQNQNHHNPRRRGSDSSSEGFREVIGADKWYIGGRTAGGEEKFFKLGVVRRVRSNDGLSLDRLSL